MGKTFQYKTTVTLEDPEKCEGCKFELETECYNRYCSARNEGEEDLLFAHIQDFDGNVEVTGDGLDGKRPAWCPLEELKNG